MTNETNHAREQAEAQMRSVKAMVAALETDYDRLEELKDERASFERDAAQEYGEGPDCEEAVEAKQALTDWLSENSEELAELIADAGDNESREDAEQRIHEDALSVEVRGGWRTLSDDPSAAEEFRIVLCTGGPHVEIRGQLSHYNEPERCQLFYQDWGTPLTDYCGPELDSAALETYARCFYFGE